MRDEQGSFGGPRIVGLPATEEYSAIRLDDEGLVIGPFPTQDFNRDFVQNQMWWDGAIVHVHLDDVDDWEPSVADDCGGLVVVENPPEGPICGDDICSSLAESFSTCPQDCAAPPQECTDARTDEDGDGLIGCADPDCAGVPICTTPDTVQCWAPNAGDAIYPWALDANGDGLYIFEVCNSGEHCEDTSSTTAVCAVDCLSDCAARGAVCGDDGCGGACGPPTACDGTPPSECFDENRVREYQLNSGACFDGQCVWSPNIVNCEFGCRNSACCAPAPCGDRECGPDPNGCNAGGCGSGCAPGDTCVDGYCVCPQQCAGRECGDDGCGDPSGCGSCPGANDFCDGFGQCQCTLTCPAGAQCGVDGCGRSCGTCAPANDCLGNFCVCRQQCGGVTCGDDGCGNATGCGACPGGFACELGQCICQPACAGRVCGDDGCGDPDGCGSCSGTDACETATGQCVATCAPDCLAKECGDDGCGLADGCGTCGANATCTVDGLCSQWSATAITGAPAARTGHIAAWTGAELIVWGGLNKNTGGRLTPSTNTWTTMTTTGAPLKRDGAAGVWTGTRLLVFGGVNSVAGHLNDGGSYNPGIDSWTALSTTGAPTPRRLPGAVWTGSLMLVWGGRNDATGFRDGGEYDPSTNTWTAIPGVFDVNSGRSQPAALWTGSRMLVWGGEGIGAGGTYPNTGALYNPSNNSWTLMSTTNAPTGRFFMAYAWSGQEFLVWGGYGDTQQTDTGGRYNPATDTWTPMTTVNAPSPRVKVSGDWIGAPVNRFVVWGGLGPPGNVFFDDGGAYDPTTDTWQPLDAIGAPTVRHSMSVTAAGSDVIVWGGEGPGGTLLNDGGRYAP